MVYGVHNVIASATSRRVHSRSRANLWHIHNFNLLPVAITIRDEAPRAPGPKSNCAHYMGVLIAAVPGETQIQSPTTLDDNCLQMY